MKKVLLFASLFFCFSTAFSQDDKAAVDSLPVDSSTNMVSFQGVEKVEGVTKDDLYTRARSWVSMAFKKAKAVIDMEDRAGGKLIIKAEGYGAMSYALTTIIFKISFTGTVVVKDGRYRYEFTNFHVSDDPGYVSEDIDRIRTGGGKYRKDDGEYRARYKGYPVGVLHSAQYFTETLKKAMSGSGGKDKDDF